MKLNQCVFRSLLMAALMLVYVAAEARVVKGVVTDQTGETVISASVVVKGTSIGTVTDFDGNYELEVPDDAKELVFSYIGLATVEMPITGDVMNVVLKENTEVLEEVVVTGYGTTKKRDLVTSVASVGADQLKDIPVASAGEALQGKLAGVSVTTSEGSPDADIKIRVRGGTSLTQSSDPLYIVDGFPVSSISDIAPGDIASMDVLKDAAATAIYGAQGANGVIIITTKETKTDDDNFRINLDYTGYLGWKQMAKPYKVMDSKEFILSQLEWARLYKNTESGMDTYFNKFFDWEYGKAGGSTHSIAEMLDYWADPNMSFDWQDATFGRHGLTSNHTVTVSGGNKKATFSFNYNRVDDESIMQESSYARNNFSFKGKFQPIKGLTIGTTVRYSDTKVLGSGTNTAEDAGSKTESRLRNAIAYCPLPGVNLSANVEAADDEASVGSLYDPLTTICDNYREKKETKWTLNAYVQYKFLKNFTLKADVGYEDHVVAQDRYYGPTTYYSRSGVSAYTSSGMGNAVSTNKHATRIKNTNSFEYKHTVNGDHSINLLVAQEMTIKAGELRTQNAYGFDMSAFDKSAYDEAGTFNRQLFQQSINLRRQAGPYVFKRLGSAEDYVSTNYIDPADNILSFIGRFDYNYKGRYYATLTFRADASTKFAKGKQWGYFPAGAFSWRIIDEEWMEKAQEIMSNLKLRVSYGLTGNNNISMGYIHPEYLVSSAVQSGLTTNKYTIGGGDIIAFNPDLKWETTTSRNIGLDLGFLNERISMTIDAYCNSTRDLLLLFRLPDGGYNYQYRNIGATQNIGAEFSINAVILQHKSKTLDYGLNFGANISTNRNRIKSLGGMEEYNVSSGCYNSGYDNSDYEYKLREGDLVGNIWGYKTEGDGFYHATDFNGYNAGSNTWLIDGKEVSTPMGEARPGMPKLWDKNKDGKIDSDDRDIIGNTQPIVNGGFNVNFYVGGENWGKVDFAANFTYSVGNDVLNLSALDYGTVYEKTRMRNNTMNVSLSNRYSFLDKQNYSLISYDGDFDNFAQRLEENNATANTASPYMSTLALTDKYVEDASFLRLSSLSMGYSLPTKYLKKAYIQNLRIFFTASNLFCATKYSGADPEVDARSKGNPLATGVDFSAFPKARAFNFGLNLSF